MHDTDCLSAVKLSFLFTLNTRRRIILCIATPWIKTNATHRKSPCRSSLATPVLRSITSDRRTMQEPRAWGWRALSLPRRCKHW